MEGIYTLQSKKEISINFDKKTISYKKRGETKYYESDKKILQRVLDKELKYLKDLVEDMNSRVLQTEVVNIKIPNGYKVRQPLNETKKEKFKAKIKETEEIIEYLTNKK